MQSFFENDDQNTSDMPDVAFVEEFFASDDLNTSDKSDVVPEISVSIDEHAPGETYVHEETGHVEDIDNVAGEMDVVTSQGAFFRYVLLDSQDLSMLPATLQRPGNYTALIE